MAGDWIPMRVNLQYGDPHVMRLVEIMRSKDVRNLCADCAQNVRNLCAICAQRVHNRCTTLCVVGALHAIWAVFDQHSSDGNLTFTPGQMDDFIGWPEFSSAMIEIGWLQFDGHNTLTMHEFEKHNGQSAKRRMANQKRMRHVRNLCAESAQSVRMDVHHRTEQNSIKDLNTLSLIEPISTNQNQNPKRAANFQKPTIEEIRQEIQARKSNVDAEQFFNFYESKGWKVGNQPMKNWKAALVTWEKRDRNKPRQGALPAANVGLQKKREALERLK